MCEGRFGIGNGYVWWVLGGLSCSWGSGLVGSVLVRFWDEVGLKKASSVRFDMIERFCKCYCFGNKLRWSCSLVQKRSRDVGLRSRSTIRSDYTDARYIPYMQV